MGCFNCRTSPWVINFSAVSVCIAEQQGCCRFLKATKHLACNRNYGLFGYLQSWRYFEAVKTDLLLQFRFRPAVLRPCEKIIREIMRSNDTNSERCLLIGAHMRRGDFTYPQKEAFGHIPAKADYLARAVDHFRKKFRKRHKCLRFVILGNDYNWNLANTPNGTDVVVLKSGPAPVDLCVLSKCNHSIISTGSFGFWAAYLAQGYTTYQKEFAKKGSKLMEEIAVEDYFMPGWVPV